MFNEKKQEYRKKQNFPLCQCYLLEMWREGMGGCKKAIGNIHLAQGSALQV